MFDRDTQEIYNYAQMYPVRLFNSGWTQYSGTVYYRDLDFSFYTNTCHVWDCVDGSIDQLSTRKELPLANDLADVVANAGRYFYDSSISRLYVRNYNDESPNTKYIAVEAEILVGSYGAYIGDKFYDPYIQKSPVFKQSFANQIFGFFPSESSTIVLNNANHWIEKYAYDFVFDGSRIKVYTELIEPGNKPGSDQYGIITGQMSSLSIGNQEATLSVRNYFEFLNLPYNRVEKVANRMTAPFSISNLHPDDRDIYLRKIFGYVRGFIPINISYNTTISTSTNRSWLVSADALASHPILSTTVNNAGLSTTTSSYVVDASGFNIGDSIVVQRSGVDKYCFCTGADYTTNIVSHTAVVGSPTNGDQVRRGFISQIQIKDGTNYYDLQYGRDWTESNHSPINRAGFILANNFEANFGMSAFDPDTMDITLAVNGIKTVPTTSLSQPIGSVSEKSGALCNPVSILYSVLIPADNPYGITSSILDDTTFDTLADSVDTMIGFTIPYTKAASVPTTKDIAVNILNSFIGRVFIKSTTEPTISVNVVGPSSTASYTIDKTDILQFEYNFNFDDVPSLVKIYSQEPERDIFLPSGTTINAGDWDYDQYPTPYLAGKLTRNINGPVGRWGLNVSREFEQQTFVWDTNFSLTPEDIARRYGYLVMDRRGTLTINVKNRFFLANIGDTIEIQREALPGYEFVFGTLRSRSFILVEKSYSNNGTILVLDDQKSIEENAGDW